MKHRVRILTSLAFAGLLVTQPGASCVSDSTTAGDANTSASTSTPPGTETVDPNDVPYRAEIVKDGRGVLEYTADADGTAYVQDVRKETTIVSHRIHRGETLVVSPDDNRVRLNDEKISDVDIKSDAEHRIYLLRDRRFDDRNDRGNAGRDDDAYATLPSRVDALDEGRNKMLSARAKRDGRVYVYDVDAKRVATSVPVSAGQRVVFAPGDDRITVDGDTVSTKNFSTRTNYRLYFSDAR